MLLRRPKRKRKKTPNRSVQVEVAGLPLKVTFKQVKNLRLTIRPPEADVLVSVPHGLSMKSVESFVLGRLDWIQGHRAQILARPRLPKPTYTTGDELFIWGELVRLVVVPVEGRIRVRLEGKTLTIQAPQASSTEEKERAVERWLNKEVKGLIPSYLEKWEARMGVKTERFSVRKMKTRWGSCTPLTRSIRLNSELGRKSPECLEYVVVHELAHLIERSHNARFKAILDRFMPDWREIEGLLNPRASRKRDL